MVTSESRECIVSPTNELRAAVSIIDMNNYNHQNQRSFDFEDEPSMIKLEMDTNQGKARNHHQRGKLQPISENTLNMFAVMVAAGIGTLAVIGLVITVFVLALK